MMRRVVSSLFLLLTAACAAPPKPADTTADTQAIREAVDAFNGFVAARNDSALAAIYSADAILMPPNMPAVTGRDTIRQFWAGFWPVAPDLKITSRDIIVAGDLAVESGVWSLSMTGPDGPVSDNGKYLVAWQRTAEGWRMTHDIYNSDNPPPVAAK